MTRKEGKALESAAARVAAAVRAGDMEVVLWEAEGAWMRYVQPYRSTLGLLDSQRERAKKSVLSAASTIADGRARAWRELARNDPGYRNIGISASADAEVLRRSDPAEGASRGRLEVTVSDPSVDLVVLIDGRTIPVAHGRASLEVGGGDHYVVLRRGAQWGNVSHRVSVDAGQVESLRLSWKRDRVLAPWGLQFETTSDAEDSEPPMADSLLRENSEWGRALVVRLDSADEDVYLARIDPQKSRRSARLDFGHLLASDEAAMNALVVFTRSGRLTPPLRELSHPACSRASVVRWVAIGAGVAAAVAGGALLAANEDAPDPRVIQPQEPHYFNGSSGGYFLGIGAAVAAAGGGWSLACHLLDQ